MLHSHYLRVARCSCFQPSLIPANNISSKQTQGLVTAASFRASPESMESKEQEMKKKEEKRTGDDMADSFGEGYSTRSDEEGFGGIYSGNTEDPEETDLKSREYDTSQGSHVSDKEKARHQKDAKA